MPAATTHSDAIRIVPLDRASLGPAAIESARELCTIGRIPELFDRALTDTPECRGLAVFDGDGAAAGVVLIGLVAGALGTGAILGLAVRPDRRRRGIGRALLAIAKEELLAEHARLIVVEMPEDASTAPMAALLESAGFEREGVVPDYHRDGVPLALWRFTPR
jgi:ribosomal protein S18 acetylase RimI-like enzyme